MSKFIFVVLLLLSWATQADTEGALTVDRSVSNNIHLSFPDDHNIKPKIGEFKIVNYVLMSNDDGERWSVITVKNLSSGNRSLEHEHLVALFADGQRKIPLQYQLNFKGKETQSITVSFGEYKFPILSIYTSNET